MAGRDGLMRGIGLLCIGLMLGAGGCGPKDERPLIGTKERPLELAVPMPVETASMSSEGLLGQFVQRKTNLVCKEIEVESLSELFDRLDEEQVDVLILPSSVYTLAAEPYGLLAMMKAVRAGTLETRGMILVRAGDELLTVADGEGLIAAAVAPASVSGCLLQRVLVTEQQALPADVMFLDDEVAVVWAVLNGDADLGFIRWCLDADGKPADARAALIDEVPDIFELLVPLAVTHAVPYDAVAVRGRVPDVLRAELVSALAEFAVSETGRAYLLEHYGIEDLVPADDVEYVPFRRRLQAAGVRLGELLPEELSE